MNRRAFGFVLAFGAIAVNVLGIFLNGPNFNNGLGLGLGIAALVIMIFLTKVD